MRLRDVDISHAYSTDDNLDILYYFYNPVLECAVKYDRITGFFSPRVFAVAARGFYKCLQNNCKIRILTSVHVEDETFEAIKEATRISDISNCLSDFNPDVLQNELEYNYLQLFMHLYASGQLELKIAAMRSGNGIMHEKIGIITDNTGDSISFSGSNNETASGWINNVEEFKVFKNWEPVESRYCSIDEEKFDKYWHGENSRFKTLSLDDEEAKSLIKKSVEPDTSLEEIVKRIRKYESENHLGDDTPWPEKHLRRYQEEAITHWVYSNYVSVFAMATGTGKTFTAISALKQFRENTGHLHCVIAVPQISLRTQWEEELSKLLDNQVEIISCGSGVSGDWRERLQKLAIKATLGIDVNFIILVTYVTLSTDDFLERLQKLKVNDLILLADEMHNLVTDRAMSVLSNERFPYRLGLSATPVRLWAPSESQVVVKFFGNDPYTFSLEKAIKSEYLVPFNYYVYPVNLTLDEFEEYIGLSKRIGRLHAIDEEAEKQATTYLLQRARIKKNAENKLPVLGNLVAKNKARNHIKYSLFYADDNNMLEKIQSTLLEKGVISSKFTGEENLATRREITAALREKNIDAIIAMKCLDEGIDIPSARSAYFLSSNTDPREYVQRLGRVLRRDDASNKTHADIYDFMVLPPDNYEFRDMPERNIAKNLVKYEVIRAKYFYERSNNSEDARIMVEDITGAIGMTFTEEELNINTQEEENDAK